MCYFLDMSGSGVMWEMASHQTLLPDSFPELSHVLTIAVYSQYLREAGIASSVKMPVFESNALRLGE